MAAVATHSLGCRGREGLELEGDTEAGQWDEGQAWVLEYF